ncbi:asparagine synthase-related protein [Haloarchaeobius sp. HRN-SO-5]|uniref:asparagine synthase-related protein n=1 Tax=Haloarchaeobius sp. HRN-SO-5 TaxID=3446118 RepID=UPI003EB8B736
MKKELFGVFGDRSEFRRYRSETEFDRVVEGDSATVGVRDVAHGIPGRTTVYDGDDGVCVLWGEVFPSRHTRTGTAEWFLDRYSRSGTDALSELNGSYVAFVDDGDDALVATDQARTWECYYADANGSRIFGTDPNAVVAHIGSPDPSTQALLEFLHLGVVLGNRTTIEQLRRTPFDGCLYRDSTEELRRFVYDPAEFDYVDELASRLQRALARRSKLPGKKGLLLSGGYDSRTILAGLPTIDECYTVGTPHSAEVEAARRVAGQYDVPHELLRVDERYLTPVDDVIRYGHGIKESLHIHHAAYDREMDVDTMYHGLLWDTFFRGHFHPRDRFEVFGFEVPRTRLEPDPGLAETLVDEKFGFIGTEMDLVADADVAGDGRAMALDAVESQLDGQSDRYDTIYNAIDLVGILNQPTMPFRNHLADNYIESFVVADQELIDWHLRTPPEHRNSRTLLKAMRRIDPDVLRHRPPDRPYDSMHLNTAQNFLRRKLPFVPDLEGPWANWSEHYDRNHFDERLFPDDPDVHDLPPRLKLRINDISTWLDATTDDREGVPSDALCSPV